MDTRRLLCWLAFFSVAGVITLIPEYFAEEPLEPILHPRSNAKIEQGPLSELHSAERTASVAHLEDLADPQPATTSLPHNDLFAAHSWYVAPALQPVVFVPAAPPAPQAPVSPPLPFVFLGKLDDNQRLRVFLLRGETIFTVSVGDVIEGTYRVERISGTQMTLVYLPLNSTQSLSVGSSL